MAAREAALVLSDGSVFEGSSIGAEPAGGIASGEIVFNTVLTGYQEVVTDPSYAGQIVTFTYPHFGNYGFAEADNESSRPFCRGVVVRDLARRPSNHRSSEDAHAFLTRHGVPGIEGIDTRRLTRLIREAGSLSGAFGTASEAALLEAARSDPGTSGRDLVSTVTAASPYRVESDSPLYVVAYDFGIKSTILRCLSEIARVEVVPASTTAQDVLDRRPNGVFLSNGPGDPAAVSYAVGAIEALLGEVPVFGICLGHQLLCRALGGETYKLPFGHHGGNHPVRHDASGRVEITSQNHNYCVDPETLGSRVEVTHTNLNDGTNEGIRISGSRAFSVQYHPEAGPGPHDSRYLFGEFAAMMDMSLNKARS